MLFPRHQSTPALDSYPGREWRSRLRFDFSHLLLKCRTGRLEEDERRINEKLDSRVTEDPDQSIIRPFLGICAAYSSGGKTAAADYLSTAHELSRSLLFWV